MNNRRAFTLVELVVVVVIIGILAAIAIPKFGGSKQKAYENMMRSDLRNLATMQEAYFNDHASVYAPTLAELGSVYRSSTGVVITIGDVTSSGWSATAQHPGSPKQCTLRVGGSNPADLACQ